MSAIVNGDLSNAETQYLKILNLHVPADIPGIDNKYLNPRTTWKDSKEYDVQARKLANLFTENMQKFEVSNSILAAGPQQVSSA